MPALAPGDVYASFDDLEQAVMQWGAESNTVFCKSIASKLSTHLSNHSQSGLAKHIDQLQNKEEVIRKIKYHKVTFICSHGGVHRSREQEQQRVTSTRKSGCPVKMYAICVGTNLLVKAVTTEHNHATSEDDYRMQPEMRRLSASDVKKIGEYVRVGADTKLIRSVMEGVTGKFITGQDVKNMTRRRKDCRPDVEAAAEQLQAQGFSTTVVHDNGEVCGVYFRDQVMVDVLSQFPELILLDSTYKLVDTRFPVFVAMCVDGMGHSQVVSVFLVTSETERMLATMLDIFRTENRAASERIKVFMTDKDASLRSAIRTVFPQASLQLCKFHVLRSFRREVVVGEHVSKDEKERALRVLQSMVHAPDETSYSRLREDLSPCRVREYFDANWHDIRHEWVLGLAGDGLFGTNTNNRLENFNGKLKDVCKLHSSLPEFTRALTALLFSQRRDRAFHVHQVRHKYPVLSELGVAGQYQALMTPFSFRVVKIQLEQMERVELHEIARELHERARAAKNLRGG